MTSNSGAGHALTRGPLAAGEIARAMQPVDHSCIGWALGRATSATTVSWDNPGGHARYSVMLVRTYDSMTGERCRDYVMTAVLDKGPLRTEDTACRNADGAWHLTVHNGAPIAPGSEILPTAQPGGAAGAPPAVPAGTGRTTAKKSAQAAPGKPPAAD